MKKFLCIFFCVIMLLSLFPLSIFAKENDITYQDLSTTSIEYDFEFVFGNYLNVKNYLKNKTDEKLYFISAMESQNLDGNKELFFYIYNPSMKTIVRNTDLDKLSLAFYTSENDNSKNDYIKRDISLIDTYGSSAETPNYTNALILKYQVNFNFSAANNVSRYYSLADFEILFPNDSNASYFIAGKQFEFFTDKSGYINCSFEDLTTLEMDAFHTFYRVDTEGVKKYTDIQSIYFPVSNELLKLYGKIYSMNLEWYTYKTNYAIVVDNKEVRDEFYNGWVNNKEYNFKYSVLYDQYFPYNSCVYDYYHYSVNVEPILKYYQDGPWYGFKWSDSSSLQLFPDTIAPIKENSTIPIKLVFYAEDVTTFEKVSIWGEEILNYIEKHNWNYSLFSPIGRGSYHNETFTVNDKTHKLNTYTLCSSLQKLVNGDYYEVETGEKVKFEHFQTIDLKELNSMSIEDFSKKYLIDKNDVKCDNGDCNSCFSCRVNNDKYKDCTWFLLRYDTTRYESCDSNVIDNTTGIEKVCNSNMFRTEVIRNLDTISVSFKDVDENGVETLTVFPIGRSPSNFVADAWNPKEKPHIKIDGILDDTLENLEKLLKIILIVLSVVLVFKIVNLFKPKKRKEKENEN